MAIGINGMHHNNRSNHNQFPQETTATTNCHSNQRKNLISMTKQIRLERYNPIEYYEKQLEKLDMQIGECFVGFLRNNILSAIRIVVSKEESNGVVEWGVKRLKVLKRGFYRDDSYITPYIVRMEQYVNIVQVDARRFDKLDKSIALINAQLNAYQGEFKKLIEE